MKEAQDSDSCSSQNLFFIKMLCAPGYRGVELICLRECVCLEHTIRYFVSFKIILRAGLSLCSCPILWPAEIQPGEDSVCPSGEGRDGPRRGLSGCRGPQRRASWGTPATLIWSRPLRKHGAPRRDGAGAAGATACHKCHQILPGASLTDKRFYRDHLFIKKIAPIMASLCSPLISSPVFPTVFKTI